MFDDRHCGAGQPSITNVPLPPLPPAVGDLVPQELLDRDHRVRLRRHAGQRARRPCRHQGPYNFGGETTQYPHVTAR